MSVRLNMGCGSDRKPGWVNVDVRPGVGDITADMTQPWPWRNGEVGEVLLSHVLEHVPDYVACIHEAYRVLNVGGLLTIRVPHARGTGACLSEHRHFFSRVTLMELSGYGEKARVWTARFRELSYGVKILHGRRTPLDWLASRMPLVWEKFGWPQPDEIIWHGEKVTP